MKKLLYVLAAALCLVACEKNPESGSTTKGDFVDLGLESGTKWKTQNEQSTHDDYNLFDYETAISEFGNSLPTKEQWEELQSFCDWERTGSSYKVTGPNGKTIVLPAAGYRNCDGSVVNVGSYGDYWSSTPSGSEYAWRLYFTHSSGVLLNDRTRCSGLSVRLVR